MINAWICVGGYKENGEQFFKSNDMPQYLVMWTQTSLAIVLCSPDYYSRLHHLDTLKITSLPF